MILAVVSAQVTAFYLGKAYLIPSGNDLEIKLYYPGVVFYPLLIPEIPTGRPRWEFTTRENIDRIPINSHPLPACHIPIPTGSLPLGRPRVGMVGKIGDKTETKKRLLHVLGLEREGVSCLQTLFLVRSPRR